MVPNGRRIGPKKPAVYVVSYDTQRINAIFTTYARLALASTCLRFYPSLSDAGPAEPSSQLEACQKVSLWKL